jgi:hypothetical protein
MLGLRYFIFKPGAWGGAVCGLPISWVDGVITRSASLAMRDTLSIADFCEIIYQMKSSPIEDVSGPNGQTGLFPVSLLVNPGRNF